MIRKRIVSAFRQFTIPAMLLSALIPSAAQAWSHQGHILNSRLAALRIINDPQAPAELRDYLRSVMPYTLQECQQLAVGDFLGANPSGRNNEGLDGAATFPDRVIQTEAGKKPIAPYNVDEGKLHYLDLEFFSPSGNYSDDLSGRPKLSDVPRNIADGRYKSAGFVTFRIDESYHHLVSAFGKSDIKSADTLLWLGYTLHYAQDIHQPQHSTADYKSLSYLAAAKVPGIRTITRDLANGKKIEQYQLDRDKSKDINPHGDVEFQLFENTQEPRATFRKQYWDLLQQQIESQHKTLPATLAQADKQPVYDVALGVLMDSYTNLPLIGHAAQAAYKSGMFDPAAFFPFKDNPQGPTILDMIARQNARAVLLSEILIRRAWNDAHAK